MVGADRLQARQAWAGLCHPDMQRKAEGRNPAELYEAGWPSLPADVLSPPHRGSGPFQGWKLKREHALAGNREMQGFSALTREVAWRGNFAWE